MKRIRTAAALLALVFLAAYARPLYSQAQTILFGSYNNAAKAVTVTSQGYMNVSVSGAGTISPTNGGTGQDSSAWNALVKVTSGTWGQYTGTSCTNQFMRSLSALGVATCATVSLTADVTGTLPAANGGSGNASYTIGDLLYASASTTLSKLADVATGSVLISGGVGVAPSWSASPTLTSVTAAFISSTANRASAGAIRLANADAINVRNFANGADLQLFGFNSSNQAITNFTIQPSDNNSCCNSGGSSNRWVGGWFGTIDALTTINAAGSYKLTSVLWESATAPTIASGGCTSPAVTSNNGTAAFLLTIGTSCTGVTTLTLTMPAAAHFWACGAVNNTSAAQQAANAVLPRATSTTAVILTNYAVTTGIASDFTASDTILVRCTGE